jgi:hypothetical protein
MPFGDLAFSVKPIGPVTARLGMKFALLFKVGRSVGNLLFQAQGLVHV